MKIIPTSKAIITVLSRSSACLLLLSLVRCQADVADGEVGKIDQAVLHDQEGNLPTCDADDGCKFDCQPRDPDCPADPADNSGPAPSTTWTLTGSPWPTDVSGFAGDDVHTLGVANSSVNAVYAILSNERSNDPCFAAIGIENVNDASIDSAPEIDHCGPHGLNSRTMHADYLDVDAGGTDAHNFISGVIVCMNGDDDKVKGVAVVGKKLSSSGTLVSAGEISDTRNNCDHWASWQQCLAGQIATAVDFHFAAGGEPKSLVGISLQCRTVTP